MTLPSKSAISLSAQKDESRSSSSSYYSNKEHTEDNCNCSLIATSTTDVSHTDSIAISFDVGVSYCPENENTTVKEDFHFVWVRKARAKFLLALPDDSEILSLKTLEHSVDVRSIEMKPANNSRCFSWLPTTLCQAEVIVAAFYNSPEFHVSEGQSFCFPPLQSKNHSKDDVVHRCCTRNKETGYINCTETINQNDWVAYAVVAVQFGSAIIFILSPLLFKYLPTRDTRIARRPRGTEPRRLGYSSMPATSVDSIPPNKKLLTLVEPLSFVTCGGDEAQACYSRLCRATALFIFPATFCLYVILFFMDNHDAKIRTNVNFYTGLVGFLKPPVEYYLFSVVVFCLILLGILVIIPGRLSKIGKALSGRKDERKFLGFEKPEQLINHCSGKVGFQFLHANMVFHMKCCMDTAFWLFILKVILSPCTRLIKSCWNAMLGSDREVSSEPEQDDVQPSFCTILSFIFLPVTMGLWTTLVVVALFVYVTPVGYVAFRIFCLLYQKDVPFKSECCERLPTCIRLILVVTLYWLFILFNVSVLSSYLLVTSMFGVFFYLTGKIFLFTLIGFGFNVEFYVPYVVAGFFGLFYIWRAFNHYVSVYENLRIVLFEECEKYEQNEARSGQTNNSNPSTQGSGTGLLLFLDNNNNPSIPVSLYIATYRRLRPRGRTFFTILVKLFLTFVYLSVAFASIMSLNKTGDTSTYVQAVFLFATFALPLVLSYSVTSDSKRRRKELEYQVRFVIHRYVAKLTAGNEVPDGIPNVDLPSTSNMFEI